MLPRRRTLLAYVLLVLGAALLAIAFVDWTAYDLVLREVMFAERRLNPEPVLMSTCCHSILHPSELWSVFNRQTHGEAMYTSAILALLALFFAAGRATRPLLAVAAVAMTTLVGLAAITVMAARARMNDLVLLADGRRLRWLWPDFYHHIRGWETTQPAHLAVFSLSLLLPLLLLAAMRVAWPWRAAFVVAQVLSVLLSNFHNLDVAWFMTLPLPLVLLLVATRGPAARRTIAAVGIPLLLAAQQLTWLFLSHVFSSSRDLSEAWVDEVSHLHVALLAAAVLCIAALLRPARHPGAPRLLPAAGLFALGLAAVIATTPHRRSIATLYPIHDPNGASLMFHWLSAPWTFDPPQISACSRDDEAQHQISLRLEAGEPVLDLDGVRRPLLGDPDIVPSHLWLGHDFPGDAPARDINLLIDRRVSTASVVLVLQKLAGEAEHIYFTGAIIQTLPTTDGPLEIWTLCTFADVNRDRLTAGAPGSTWADIVDDPVPPLIRRLLRREKRP